MARLRRIKKIGGTHYIKLEPSDLKDFRLKEQDCIDVENILKTPVRKEVKKQ